MSRSSRQPTPLPEPVRRTEAGPWSIELLPASAYQARYVASQSSIGFAFDSQRGSHAIGSDRVRPFTALPNGLAFVPAGCDLFSESTTGGEYLLITRNDGASLPGDHAVNNVIDPQAIVIAQRMRQAMLQPVPADELESWAIALAVRATGPAIATATGTERTLHTAGSMTSKRLRLLDEFIDAHMGGTLSVHDMAQLLGLSEGYFMRAFTQATGTSPHSYLIDRRLACARQRLRTTKDSLADIAQACGFASQAHLATTFKKRLGLSPSCLRA